MSIYAVGRIADIADVTMGQSPAGVGVNREKTGVPLLNGPSEFGQTTPTPVQWTEAGVRFANAGDVLFCVRGSTTGRMNLADTTYAIGRGLASIRGKESDGSRFVLYALQNSLSELLSGANGSVFPNLTRDQIANHRIPLPSSKERASITDVLGVLDAKIDLNSDLIARLDSYMNLEYKQAVGNKANVVPLDSLAIFHNRRRIPLSARERELRPGNVPYYGASGVFGTVNEGLFDQTLVLVGEDGSVINEDGTPVTQYIWGPAWVNNHAHVLTGSGISTELLYIAVARSQVSTLVTGAVQPKINMGNLRSLMLEVPSAENLPVLETNVGVQTATKRALSDENKSLRTIRNFLLPQLMSGKLRVKDAEKVLENAGV